MNNAGSSFEKTQIARVNSGAVIWLTGLAASGKTSIASELHSHVSKNGFTSYVLDGDKLRQGINRDLTFSREDRAEASRRAAEVALLLAESGAIVTVAMISPFAEDRQKARNIILPIPFLEVWVNTELATCIERDPKGLYKKSIRGEVKLMTGVSQEYEPPESPELEVGGLRTIQNSVELISTLLFARLS